jgi:hypothetical protein
LFAECCGQSSHLLLEGFAVVLDSFSPDVPAGREHIAVLLDFLQLRRLAEAGNIGVFSGSLTLVSMKG